MVDNIGFSIKRDVSKIVNGRKEAFMLWAILFIPFFNKIGDLKYFKGFLNNLQIKLNPYSNKIFITNSLHKYKHGCNYTDFPLSQLKETIYELSDLLHENLLDANVNQTECGCNIIVPDSNASWKRVKSYNSKSFEPITSYSKTYGSSSFFKQYTVKAYNKTAATLSRKKEIGPFPVPQNLFRWEVAYRRMAALYNRKVPIPIYKGEDLIDIEKMQYLCDDVVAKYNDSIKACSPNLNGLSLKQITALSRIGNADISSIMKENHPDTYKCDRNIYNKIIKQAQLDAENDGKLIQEKMCELLNS